ncbi:MAG: aminomethyl-transferring glycine dehydrogenase subunit GcvPB, partial [Bacillota bacterium]
CEDLVEFLPQPLVEKDGDSYSFKTDMENSIGKVRSFYGNFGVVVRAYAYILALGAQGIKQVSEDAVLNANYLKEQLKGHYKLPHDRTCKHEFVLSGNYQKEENHVATLDIAKRLLDFEVHPPTVYFPLIVEEALMIEPTETETVETLDKFVDTMIQIAEEAKEDPETVQNAPHNTVVGRLDETTAARKPKLKWTSEK